MEKQSALSRENKRLRYRWTSLRKLLGIEQKQEETLPMIGLQMTTARTDRLTWQPRRHVAVGADGRNRL
jgi:hypothetical protein